MDTIDNITEISSVHSDIIQDQNGLNYCQVANQLDNDDQDVKVDKIKRYDMLLKILLVGDSFVGKTCVIKRFVSQRFQFEFLSTIIIDFKTTIIELEGKRIKLQIWDVSGREKYAHLIENYFRGSDAVIYCYDIQKRESFHNIHKWITLLKSHICSRKIVKVVLGCKSDQDNLREVTKEEAHLFAIEQHSRYWECSAKADANVSQIFENTTLSILANLEENSNKAASSKPLEAQTSLPVNWRRKLSVKRGAKSLRKSLKLSPRKSSDPLGVREAAIPVKERNAKSLSLYSPTNLNRNNNTITVRRKRETFAMARSKSVEQGQDEVDREKSTPGTNPFDVVEEEEKVATEKPKARKKSLQQSFRKLSVRIKPTKRRSSALFQEPAGPERGPENEKSSGSGPTFRKSFKIKRRLVRIDSNSGNEESSVVVEIPDVSDANAKAGRKPSFRQSIRKKIRRKSQLQPSPEEPEPDSAPDSDPKPRPKPKKMSFTTKKTPTSVSSPINSSQSNSEQVSELNSASSSSEMRNEGRNNAKRSLSPTKKGQKQNCLIS